MSAGIYKLTSPSGKCYIGQSVQLEIRHRRYKNLECDRQPKLYNAILKYGWENFKIEILFSINIINKNRAAIVLDAIERFCIKKYDSVNSGYNIMSGGSFGRHSPETIEKIRIAHTGIFHTEETKLKLSKLKTGIIKSEETRQKLRIASTGRIYSAETRLKLSILHAGKPKTKESIEKRKLKMAGYKHSEESKRKIGDYSRGKKQSKEFVERRTFSLRKCVLQYDLNNNFIAEWNSVVGVERGLGIDKSSISACCNGKRNKAGGFIWRFKE